MPTLKQMRNEGLFVVLIAILLVGSLFIYNKAPAVGMGGEKTTTPTGAFVKISGIAVAR